MCLDSYDFICFKEEFKKWEITNRDRNRIDMKKKEIRLLLGIVLLLGLTGCSENKHNNADNAKEVQENQVTEEPKPTEIPQATTEPYSKEQVEVLKTSIEEGNIKDDIFYSKNSEFQMNIPKDWTITDDKEEFHISKGESNDKDRLKIEVSEKDLSFEENDQDAFEEFYTTLVDDLEILSFKHITIANLPAIEIVFKCKSKDEQVDMTHYQYLIDGKCTYTIAFVEVENDMEETIQNCIQSIQIKEP